MATNSKIEWTGSTWNPITGCDKISLGCQHCYAERLANRLRLMGVKKYKNGFKLTLHPELIDEPLSWKKPRIVFVNSMSDLFHNKVPFSYIKEIFSVMEKGDMHIFQILTKRSERLLKLNRKLFWPENVWMGVTVENAKYVNRIDDLRATIAHVKWLSLEPLLGPISNLDLTDIDWVVVGGESGPQARPIEKKWVLEIQAQCVDQKVPFFFKQWGGINKKKTGRILEGKTWSELPKTFKKHPNFLQFNIF